MENIKPYMRKEIVTPVAAFAIMTAYVIVALNMSPLVVNGLLQESFFPLLIYIFGVPAVIFLFVDGYKKIKKEAADKTEIPTTKRSIKPLLIGLISFFLVLGFEPLGFLITAPIFIFCFMLIYDDKLRQIPRKIIFTLIITALVYLLYTIVFDIQFPVLWS
ncbi:MAG: tripartite tricarboxylate transporter TctB family protein [Spirochaetales bacterium]|jgi:hypothetical protein|nr:tripartite tricarboxylate transporter TctB family protein [Spirochaetales bacterium]